MMTGGSIIFIIVLGIAMMVLHDYSIKRRALKFVKLRGSISHRQFADVYFPEGKQEIAAKVRELLADHLPVDALLTLPSDKLNEDLRMDDLDSMSNVEFILDLEKHFKIDIKDEDARKLFTLADVINHVAEKIEECPR